MDVSLEVGRGDRDLELVAEKLVKGMDEMPWAGVAPVNQRVIAIDDLRARVIEQLAMQRLLGCARIRWWGDLRASEVRLQKVIRDDHAARAIAVEQMVSGRDPEVS